MPASHHRRHHHVLIVIVVWIDRSSVGCSTHPPATPHGVVVRTLGSTNNNNNNKNNNDNNSLVRCYSVLNISFPPLVNCLLATTWCCWPHICIFTQKQKIDPISCPTTDAFSPQSVRTNSGLLLHTAYTMHYAIPYSYMYCVNAYCVPERGWLQIIIMTSLG